MGSLTRLRPSLQVALGLLALAAAYGFGRLSKPETIQPKAGSTSRDVRFGSESASRLESSSAIPEDLQGSGMAVVMTAPKGQPLKLVPVNVPGVSERRIMEFIEVLSLSHATERQSRFATILQTLTKAEAQAMRRLFHNFRVNGLDLNGQWDAFWGRWGQLDAPSALENAAQFDPKESWVRNCTEQALRGWAIRDPAAAAAWLNTHRDDPLHEAAFVGYLTGIGDHDLAGATKIALGALSADDPLLNTALERLAELAVGQGQVAGLTSWFETLPRDTGHGGIRRLAVEQIWWRLQRTGDLARTAQWMTTTANQPWRVERFLFETARKYAEQSPSEAMEWVAALPPSPVDGRLTGIDQVARRWMQRDRAGFEQWLRSEGRTAAADQAGAAYAAELMKSDPESARAWVDAIGNEELRRGAMSLEPVAQ